MKKLLLSLLLMPSLTLQAEEITGDPDCVLKYGIALKDEKYARELIAKERKNIDERLFYYWAEIHRRVLSKGLDLSIKLYEEKKNIDLRISEYAPFAEEFNKIKEEEAKIMAQFYREKKNKFSNYSIEDQSLLLAEAELILSAFLNNINTRAEISEAVQQLRRSEGKNKMSQEEMLKPLIDFINCMNKDPQDDSLERAEECVKMNIKVTLAESC